MIATTLRHILRHIAFLASFTVCSLLMIRAAPASESSSVIDKWSSARLLSGSNEAGAKTLRAGVEIKLAPGWNTYWRYPGDSGVPPRFDFSASENVDNVSVHWPAPQRIIEEGDTIIGYTNDVILPLSVRPKDPRSPVTLRVKLDYAVCQKLCVPVDAALTLSLAQGTRSGTTGDDALLATAEQRVPTPVPLGEPAPFAVQAVQKETGSPPRVVVDVVAPAPVVLFAEGPTPEWALPLPRPVDGATPGVQRFSFELDGLPAGADARGAVLTLTAVSAGQAIETKATLE
jgi:DsbC/DsbD-like thiol-disulfide interchange protein